MVTQQEHNDGVEQEAAVLGSTTDTDVKVVVRVRPIVLGIEPQPDVHTCVEVEGHNSLTVRSGNETTNMQFNWVAGPATTQAEFFKVVGRPTVENCLSGFNACILAYGQTGSGKTHTMIGELPQDSDVLLTNAGLIPRIFQYLWRRMPEVQASMLSHCAASMAAAAAEDGIDASSNEPSLTWLVRCSMLEIRREDIIDLLRPGNGPLTLREDIRKGVYVEGLCETVVENVQDALAVLQKGIANRQVTSIDYPAASSHSHCIFTCYVESRLEPQPGLVNVRSSRLHLVDLAGSERLKHGPGALSNGEGSERLLKEATSINRSLPVLGMVILKLSEQQPHIPYRNSKLTLLLQESIGGNAKTVIIANVSPSEVSVQETLSTLDFAIRARKLVNKAVTNEDTSGDAAVLRADIKRLKSELVLARQLIQHSTAHAKGQTAAELEEQQAQLQQALTMLAELGDRNSELEDALEYSKRERCELERGCLEARQELAAVQVTLQQTVRENRNWRHRWFKVDTSGRSLASSRAASESGAEAAGPPAASCAAASPVGQPEVATTAETGTNDSDTLSYTQQDQHTEPILKLLNSRLTEVVSTVRPAAISDAKSGNAETTTALGRKVRQSLADLAAICKPKVQEVPELSSVVDSLELIAAWQQYQSPAAEPHSSGTLGTDPTDAAAVGSHTAACDTVSGIPRTSFTPLELHRQLREERQLNTKLSEQVRQLQQKLLLAAETAGAAGKNLLSLSSDSMLRGSCITALQAAADAADTADSAAAAVAARQSQQQPVVVQLNIWDGREAEPEQLELAAAKAKIAGLQQQVAQLQERLEVVSRERAGLQSRLASARTVLAAARCSTPSSLNSSRLPSPQPCFSPLRSVIGESIDEGIEEDYEGIPPPGSWRSRHQPPGSPNTPVNHISTPLSSHNSQELAAECSGPLVEEDSETALSPQTHWDREHNRYQQHQQELEKRKNLARAVHVAIKEAGCPEDVSPGVANPSPASSSAGASGQRSPSLRPYATEYVSSPLEGSYSRLSASIDHLQQQLQQAVADTRVVRSGTPGRAFRASLGYLDGFSSGSKQQQQQQQLEYSSVAERASAAAGCSGAGVRELLCRTAGLLMPGSAAAGAAALGLQMLCADSSAGMRTDDAAHGAAVADTSPSFDVDSSTGGTVEGAQAADSNIVVTTASGPAAAEAAATSAAAEAEQGADEASCELQQRQQPTPGPAWEMADYEEEFRQLQEQLQELLTANSGLKATLQQRERALADKDAQLEQQGHDLECCEQMVQELHERLATSEAAAAAAAAEHCDAIWFKGQYEGLLELNEELQVQLEVQGQELHVMKAALERFIATEAAPQTAEAYAAAAELYHSDGLVEDPPGSSTAEQHVDSSAPETEDVRNSSEAACTAHVVAPHGDEALFGSHVVSAGLAGDPDASGASQQPPTQDEGVLGTAAVAAAAAGHDPQSTLAHDLHEHQQRQQQLDEALAKPAAAQCRVQRTDDAEPMAATSPAAAAAAIADSAVGSPAVTSTPAADEQVTPASTGSTKHTAGQLGRCQSSVQQRLLLQTSQLAAQPADPEIAANQAILLRHQLEAVGLQLQHKQLEVKLAHVKLQMDRLQQHQQAQLHHQQMQLQRYQRHRQQLGLGYLTPAGSQHKLLLDGGAAGISSSGSDQPLSSGSSLFARLSADSTILSSQKPSMQYNAAARTSSSRALGTDQDMRASKTSPLSLVLDRRSSSDPAVMSVSDFDANEPDTALTPGPAGSPSPDCTVRSSNSCRSSLSDASSSGQCFDMISDLVQRLNALAQEQHDTSTFKAASASTLSPMPAKFLSWPAAAAAQLQTRLQVSSAYELDAAREMVAMTENLIGLQVELRTAEKAARSRRTQQKQQQQQLQPPDEQQLKAAESSVVKSLLSRFDIVQPGAEPASATEVCGVADVPLDRQQKPRAGDADARPADLDKQQQEQQPSVNWLQLVARLEQQQQSILKALESQSSVGSADLADMQAVQQQLLQQLRSTTFPPRRESVLHHEGSWQSVDSTHGNSEIVGPGQQQQSELPPSLPDSYPQALQEPATATAFSKTLRSASPSKRQLRSRKRQMLRRSLDSSLGAVAATPMRKDVGDEHHLRDSCKGDRLQQILLKSKAQSLRGSMAVDTCDGHCLTDAEVLPPADNSRSAKQPLELQLVMAHPPGPPEQHGDMVAGVQSIDQEVTLLKGEVAKLRMQVDQFKTRAKVAEEGRLRLAQAMPRSYSSLSSRGDRECRSSVEGSEYGSCLTADVTSSAGSAAAADRLLIVPAGLFSPRAASASISGGCSSPPGAASSKFSQQHSSLHLYSRFRELQAQCMLQAQTIQQLENLVRQQDMQLQQAAVGITAAAGSGGSWGGSTPRVGLLSPRVGLGAVSPRITTFTPNKSFVVPDKITGGCEVGHSTLSVGPGYNTSSGGNTSPSKASRLGGKAATAALAATGGGPGVGWFSSKPLAAVPETSPRQQQQLGEYMELDDPLFSNAEAAGAAAADRGSLGAVDRRRLSLGPAAVKGHKLGGIGRLRVAALSKASQRRQTLG